MADDFISEASGAASVSTAVDFIAEVSGAATQTVGASDFIAFVHGTSVTSTVLSVDLGPDILGLEPYTTQTITAVVTGGPAATLSISQILGPAVLISAVVPADPPTSPWRYETPAEVDANGSQVKFQVVATDPGGQSASAEVDHFIYPNTWAYYNAAGQLLSARATTTGVPE